MSLKNGSKVQNYDGYYHFVLVQKSCGNLTLSAMVLSNFLCKNLPKVHVNNCVKLLVIKINLTVNYKKKKGEGFPNIIMALMPQG